MYTLLRSLFDLLGNIFFDEERGRQTSCVVAAPPGRKRSRRAGPEMALQEEEGDEEAELVEPSEAQSDAGDANSRGSLRDLDSPGDASDAEGEEKIRKETRNRDITGIANAMDNPSLRK